MHKDSYESMIGEAILADKDSPIRARNLARISCKMAASRQMFCGCGNILDQRRCVVLTHADKPRVLCKKCYDELLPSLQEICNQHQATIEVETWDGQSFIKPKAQ